MRIEKLVYAKKNQILKLAAEHGVKNVRVFGSVARGDSTLESDVDFLVELEPGRTLLDLGGLMMDLKDLLKRKIDVVTVDGLHWAIREKVLKEAMKL